MEHNAQLYDKIQGLYEEYWEINSHFHKDSDYYPIIKQLDDILYEHPDNEYALQLKIIIKRSYRRPPKEELKALCEHLYRINPKNQFAKTSKLRFPELKFPGLGLRIFHKQSKKISKGELILASIIIIALIINLIMSIIDLTKMFVR